ncbi:MAG: hypothetical protein IJU76_14305 [Desulfovibrionaceae bacterium]|nr:hypothetical protein [Desulfovibrionaceae bacterium]
MQTKKYTVTNLTDHYIRILGIRSIEIPKQCSDFVLELPDNSAKKTIARLKGSYPFLKIVEYKEPVKQTISIQPVQPVQTVQTPAPDPKEATQEASKSDKNAKSGK